MAQHVELPIAGMTCASCANRIERKLNKLDGVSASVNYATEKATVDFDAAAVAPEALVAAVEAAGYQAVAAVGRAGGRRASADETAPLRQRLLVSLALMLPVLAMAMIPPLQFDNWQWLSLTLAAPVVVWGALAVPPRGVGEPPARRRDDGHADLARRARRLRVVAVRAVHRRRRHARHDDELRPDPRARRGRGRDLPRGRRRGDRVPARGPLLRGARQAPRRARPSPRCSSWAPRTSRSSTPTAPSAASRSSSSRSATASSCARARRSRPTASSRRAPAPSTSRC